MKIAHPMRKKARLLCVAGAIAIVVTSEAAAKNWGAWIAPASLEALPGSSSNINSAAVDGCASLSPDGLTIAFNSDRTGNQDIYMATRASPSEGFGDPVRLPAPINTSSIDSCPTIASGHRLYFTSFRDGAAGDLYVSKLGTNGWSEPDRLGPNINTDSMQEEAADFYEDDEGREVMLFTSRPAVGPGKIYQSIDGGPATLVAGGPHSSASDARASVTQDGLTIFWDSTRTGSLGGPDIWYASRSNTSEPFGTAVQLTGLSSPAQDLRPFISKDGSLLTFSSNRSGSESAAPDIWFTSRTKITGN